MRLYIARLRETATGPRGNVPKDPRAARDPAERDEVELDLRGWQLARARARWCPSARLQLRSSVGSSL